MAIKSRRFLPLILVILAIAVSVFVFVARAGGDRPPQIAVARPTRQTLTSSISTNGKVEPIDPRVIEARLTTFVQSVQVKEGQTVRASQVLMQLDANDLQSELARSRDQLVASAEDRRVAAAGGSPDELAQIEDDLSKTNADIARLRKEAESLKRLYDKQAATSVEVDQNRIALERAEADRRLLEEKRKSLAHRSRVQTERAALQEQQASSSIRSLEEKIIAAHVIAPFAGTLYSLEAKAGNFVHMGDVLGEMADIRRVRVRAFVDEPELGSLKEGQFVEVTWDALPNRTWSGQIEQLPRTIVARGSRNVGEVLCSVSNEDSELLPNMNVNVRIDTAQRQNTLTVPRSAVRTEGNTRFVLMVENGHLRKQQVTVGISSLNQYEITAGLADTDIIALPGNAELRDGQAVSVVGQK